MIRDVFLPHNSFQHLRELPRHLYVTVLHDLRLDSVILDRPQFLVFTVCLEQVIAEFLLCSAVNTCFRLVQQFFHNASVCVAEGEDWAAGGEKNNYALEEGSSINDSRNPFNFFIFIDQSKFSSAYFLIFFG